MDTPWEGRLISAEEFDRLQQLYRPLADAVRELIDATVRTEADEVTVAAAANAVREVSASLTPFTEQGWHAVRHADTGQRLVTGRTKHICVDRQGHPCVIPSWLWQAMGGQMENPRRPVAH